MACHTQYITRELEDDKMVTDALGSCSNAGTVTVETVEVHQLPMTRNSQLSGSWAVKWLMKELTWLS